jgi:hypothetical protein
MLNQKEKSVIAPVFIFKQAWSICRKNLSKLSIIYLIFNLPIVIISLSPMISSLSDQKLSLAGVVWFLFLIVTSSWGQVALFLGAHKAVGSEDYTVSQTISQAKLSLIKYLALLLVIAGIVTVAAIFIGVIGVLLPLVNKILAGLILIVLIIAAIAAIVFFSLRWSLAALVCVLESTRPITALKRSFSLVREHINPVVGIYGLLMLINCVCWVPMFITGVLSGAGQSVDPFIQMGMTVYMLFINIVLVPFCVVTTVVLYKNLKEALEANVYA